MGKLDMRLEENEKRGNKNGYFVGDAMTIADLKVYVMTGGLFGYPYGNYVDGKAVMAANKRLSDFRKVMGANEGIKKFLIEFAERTKTFKKDATKNVFKEDGKASYGSL